MYDLSIITINYNNAAGLEATIKSIASQTFCGFEYIVVDGLSTDGSTGVIQKYKHLISQQIIEKDTGVYNAMNKGIRMAQGKYLLFLNSGDTLMSSDVLTQLVDGEQEEIDLIYGDLHRSFPDGSEDLVKLPDFITVDIMLNWTLCHPVTLIHRRLFETYGFYDERLTIVADWAFFLKVIVLGDATQKHKPVIVSNFRMDGVSSLAENQQKIHEEREG